jgi:hypothetical protein
MREYMGKKFKIYHFDMYRLTSGQEAKEFGLEDYIYSKDKNSIVFIEWPENVSDILVGEFTRIDISIVDKLSLKDSFINTGFKIKDNYVHGFSLNDLLTNIKDKVKLDYTTNGNSIIATGVEFKYNSELLTAVVYGDLNGDGKINSADLLKMRQHLLGTSTLKDAYKEAAMITNSTSINSANLLRLRQHLLGQKLIEQ